MILVDTSVWIDLFSRRPTVRISPDKMSILATCPPVIQELLQGLGRDKVAQNIREGILALPCIHGSITTQTYIYAADIYRNGRSHGFTIRSSIDCLIAAIAIEAKIPIWHKDRDFGFIARYTDLVVIANPP